MFTRCLLAVLAVLLSAALARADGLIIIPNPPERPNPDHFSFAPLSVTEHHVSVTIEESIATTSVDQSFYNDTGRVLEGEYVFPLPPGATVDRFSMEIDGKDTPAELLDATKARQLYEDIVRKQRDPALMEYTGRGAFRVRVFPIEPAKPKRIQLKYTQVIKPDAGLSEYVYPLNTEKFSAKPLKNCSIAVNVKSTSAIKSVYSPSHTIDISRRGENEVVAGYEAKDVRPDTDFKLIYTTATDNVGLHVVTYRPDEKQDGYFVVLASAGEAKDQHVDAKDVLFILDTSGSMKDGNKIKQAKKALQYCLRSLGKEDRFDVIRFSTDAETLSPGFQAFDEAAVDKAAKWVDDFDAAGGTAIGDAFAAAVRLIDAREQQGRPVFVIFLTDGQPTVGERNEDKLVAMLAASRNTKTLRGAAAAVSVRVFPFGVGADVNTLLLDRIAADSRAFSQYVLPNEDIEVKVSRFYEKIASPLMSEVAIQADGGATISQMYPTGMPDLFKGETLLAFGRYRGEGETTLSLTGRRNGEAVSFSNKITFPAKRNDNHYVARLWATRRIGFLLDEIRVRGETPEVRDEVVRLAREHGVVTPYTSYLILEDERHRDVPLARRTLGDMEKDKVAMDRNRDYYDSSARGAKQQVAGERAVENAMAGNDMKSADNLATLAASPSSMAKVGPATTQPAEGYLAYQRSNYAQQTRLAAGRAMYLNGNTWTDSQVQANAKLPQKQIAFASDDYFKLLAEHSELAEVFSIGNNVDVVIDDALISVR